MSHRFSKDMTASRAIDLSRQPQLENVYKVYQTKLVKFRDTKLKALRFTQSGARGKLLITLDHKGTIRFHKIRGLKSFLELDFAS